jgi:hypothetical protein
MVTLGKIFSANMRKRCLDVLRNPEAEHNERCWLVGFLQYCGFTDAEIYEIIHKLNRWDDYVPEITDMEIDSVLRSIGNRATQNKPSAYRLYTSGTRTLKVDFYPVIDLSHADIYNQTLLKDAERIGIELSRGVWTYKTNGARIEVPDKDIVYRSCEGRNHYWFVIDLDSKDPARLQDAWVYAKMIYKVWDFDIIKFSGAKGFHLMKKLPGSFNHEHARRIAENLCEEVGTPEVYEFVDFGVYTRGRMIRGFCKNLKSGLYSIPVDTTQSLSDILQAAKEPLSTPLHL